MRQPNQKLDLTVGTRPTAAQFQGVGRARRGIQSSTRNPTRRFLARPAASRCPRAAARHRGSHAVARGSDRLIPRRCHHPSPPPPGASSRARRSPSHRRVMRRSPRSVSATGTRFTPSFGTAVPGPKTPGTSPRASSLPAGSRRTIFAGPTARKGAFATSC